MYDILIPLYVFIFEGEEYKIDSIKNEIVTHSELELNIVDQTNTPRTPENVMINVRMVLAKASLFEDEVIIFASSDFKFTKSYSKSFLIDSIIDADELRANILFGDVIDHKHMVPLNKRMFWVDTFYETNLFVLFRRFFKGFLGAKDCGDTLGDILSEITSNKVVIFPFIVGKRNIEVPPKAERSRVARTDVRVSKSYKMWNYFLSSNDIY